MRCFRIRTLATVAVAALALAACGSSSKTSSPSDSTTTTAASADTTTTAAAPTTTAAPKPASVKVGTTSIGKVLTDAKGMTLYRFDNDTTAGKSACTGACASAWPAATGAAVAGAGIDGSKLTTFTRDDGTKQLQMDGHPLYTFAGDTKPGDVSGKAIPNWHAASPTGDKVSA
jgi:predicted lipoprotein with Yx(FWY)xxD motif